MKPYLLKIHLEPEHSFNVRYDIVDDFYNRWHYHPEFELVHIVKGFGQQFIGHNIHRFSQGEMVITGPNLPHLWRNDKIEEPEKQSKVEAVVIHFRYDSFGDDFFSLPENSKIGILLEKSKQGVRIEGESKKSVDYLIKRLITAEGTERIILFLQILNTIGNSKQIQLICSKDIVFQYSQFETERLNDIYQFILNNFSQQISLPQIAKIAHLSPNSFCRYFKSRIQKTFSQFLIEIRIKNACRLLADTQKSIAEISFESGYNSFSNFNRHFKLITGRNPLAQRKYYKKVNVISFDEGETT